MKERPSRGRLPPSAFADVGRSLIGRALGCDPSLVPVRVRPVNLRAGVAEQ